MPIYLHQKIQNVYQIHLIEILSIPTYTLQSVPTIHILQQTKTDMSIYSCTK